jgi:hypothetical protein
MASLLAAVSEEDKSMDINQDDDASDEDCCNEFLHHHPTTVASAHHHQCRSRRSKDTKELSNSVHEAIRSLEEQEEEEETSSERRILKKTKKKGVSFSIVEISAHPMIVGDNPGGLKGCPVTIGWESIANFSYDLNDYESVRTSNHRRSMGQMQMSAYHRETTLRDLGFSRQEIMWGIKTANVIRNQRRHRNELIKLDEFHAWVECAQRKLWHILTLGKSKRRERKLFLGFDGLVNNNNYYAHADDVSKKKQDVLGTTSASSSRKGHQHGILLDQDNNTSSTTLQTSGLSSVLESSIGSLLGTSDASLVELF